MIKETSSTTKCRVVYDGSCKTDTGSALNDTLATGPKTQDNFFDIVLRLRLYRYILSADVKMMFRQINVHEEQRKFPKIIWRFSTEEPYQIYILNTVTYGMTSSAYLATKCLQKLAEENEKIYPRTCAAIKNSFYMDDVLMSVNTREEALQIQREMTEILKSAGFILRKWSSNDKGILESIERNSEPQDKLIEVKEEKEMKTLGLLWNGNTDTLHYTVEVKMNSSVTKRTILSTVCKIFDPLGLIGPVIIKAKIIIQALWQLQITWDEEVPKELRDHWLKFAEKIEVINEMKIKRQVLVEQAEVIELHGYSDASEKAYGACVYLRSRNQDGNYQCNLICAKSRVAPLKSQTLPRLELMAAL